uniref:KRAB domain-containing protein n=1 Tax=Laticauda laticaudata TaxID=8630 RepID=A0A8C5RAS3_LATLA
MDCGFVFFEEVAVYFSEEEWSQPYPDPKALYSEVMLENHRNMISLGNNGQENQDSCEVFQVISAKFGEVWNSNGIQKPREKPKNWNQES